MSLIFRSRRDLGDTPQQLIPPRGKIAGTAFVSNNTAMTHSAVWACLRVRADLVSTMELNGYRKIATPDGNQIQVPITPTPFLLDPAGDGFGMEDWLYSSQIELDRTGNNVGVITVRDGFGLPAVVELAQMNQVSIKGKGGKITGYRIAGSDYQPVDVWHERQFTQPGVPIGMSPIGYAAMAIGAYLSAQEFGLQWFANGRVPTGKLKNLAKTINPDEADVVKKRFRAALETRDVFVHGKDWEYDLLAVNDGESQFINLMNFGITEIARFMGVPGDIIDAPAESGAKITYANITQRNLQLLVMNLAPTLVRRERTFSRRVLPSPRYVQFDPTTTLLRMDPSTKQTVIASMIDHRQLTPSEAREDDNREPLTAEQIDEFNQLFGKGADNPARKGIPQ